MAGDLSLKEGKEEVEITQKISQDSMKAGLQAPFFSLTYFFSPFPKKPLLSWIRTCSCMCMCWGWGTAARCNEARYSPSS